MGDIVANEVSQIITVDARKFADCGFSNSQMGPMVIKYAAKFIESLNDVKREDLTDLLERVFRAEDTLGVIRNGSVDLSGSTSGVTMSSVGSEVLAKVATATVANATVVPTYDLD